MSEAGLIWVSPPALRYHVARMDTPPADLFSHLIQTLIMTSGAVVALGIAVKRGCFRRGVLSNAPMRRVKLNMLDCGAAIFIMLFSMSIAAGVFLSGLDEYTDPIEVAVLTLVVQVLGYLPSLMYVYVRLKTQLPESHYSEVRMARRESGSMNSRLSSNLAPNIGRHMLARFGLGRFKRSHLTSSLTGLLLALPVVFSVNAIILLFRMFAGHQPPESGHELLSLFDGADNKALLLLALCASVVLVAPFVEEIIYRGVVQTALMRLMGKRARPLVLIIAGVFFGFVHIGSVPAEVLPALMILGVILGWLYETTGSLWPSMIVHCLFNALNLTLAMLVSHYAG